MPRSTTQEIANALRDFANSVHEKLGVAGAPGVWPEDQLKGPVETLFKISALALGQIAVVRTEAPRPAEESEDGGSRVDAAVSVGRNLASTVLTGHIELKAPSKSGDPRQLTGKADKAQWKKFQRLPNLVYTNGREWTLQRTGKQIGDLVRFSGDPIREGASAVTLEDAAKFEALISTFFAWEPIVPHTSRQIAELLAPLCRLLRTEAIEALKRKNSALTGLATEVRKYLFPGASNEVVADAYAQTFTYALLIARFEGANPLSFESAERALESGHGLLSEVLHLLDSAAARKEVETSTQTLLRVIGQVKPAEIVTGQGTNPWLYFYEEFLAAYDPVLRKKVGAYYTPVEIVQAQTSFVHGLLVDSFGKPMGFADSEVVTLDPAVGTGTYPLGILQSIVDSTPDHARGALPEILRRTMSNLYGIEYLIGPYSVAHLRLSRFLADHGVDITSDDPLKILLADTLASHEVNPEAMLPGVFGYEEILQEREIARELKVDTRVVVCIGNPPYLRGKKSDGGAALGGWVTLRRAPIKGQKVRDPITRRLVADRGDPGIITDFTEPVITSGHGGDLKNLYNAYVYFWRWALWKVFEQDHETETPVTLPGKSGIVSFITASSYLRGPGFTGMRQHLRSVLDEIWIVDLGGDNKGGRKTENVFSIQTPVAIATGVRYGDPDPDTPARIHYVTLADLPAAEKRARLSALSGLTDETLEWQDVMSGWQDPFLPTSDQTYLAWPALTDLFPWQVSGAQVKRSWPIGETESVLRARWAELTSGLPLDQISSNAAKDARSLLKRRSELLHESRDLKVIDARRDLFSDAALTPLSSVTPGTSPVVKPYAFRSFDEQYIIADSRVGDYLRASLWRTHSAEQRYITSLLTVVLGRGPSATATRSVPDMHNFSGRGGKDVIPLWRNKDATEPNVTAGLLDALAAKLGIDVSAEDFFNYAYGVLANSSYAQRFWDPLTVPGPRIPVTRDADLFGRVRDHGAKLMKLHTVELFTRDVLSESQPGDAVYSEQVSSSVYPDSFSYDAGARTLSIGTGRFSNVRPEVWDYSVSGLQVIDSWLGYRLKKRYGRKGSELDNIRPVEWPDLGGEQMLRLLWTLEQTVDLESEGSSLLDELVDSHLLLASELPIPTEGERQPFGSEDDPEDDEDPEDEADFED